MDKTGAEILTLYEQTGLFKLDNNYDNSMFSPDSDLFITVSRNGIVRLWSIDGTLVAELDGHSGTINHVEFSPDGQRILVLSDGITRVWQTDGTFIASFQDTEGAKFSLSGQSIFTWSGKTLRRWSVGGSPLATLYCDVSTVVESAMYSPDGQHIATNPMFASRYSLRSGLSQIWDTKGTLLASFGNNGYAFEPIIAFSPDGNHVLTRTSGDSRLYQIDGTLIVTVDGYGLAFSPDGQHILTTNSGNDVQVWKTDGTPIVTLSGLTATVSYAEFSHDGKNVIARARNGEVKVWSVDGTPVPAQNEQDILAESNFDVTFSISDTMVSVQDMDGKRIATLTGHTDYVSSATLSPDSELIATASADGTARLWKTDGTPLAILQGHTDRVTSATFSPDGELIATASADGTARLWKTDGTPVAVLQGHTGPVTSVVFSPDGGRLLTGSSDGTARQYLVNIQDLLAVAACQISRDMTQGELDSFGIDEPGFTFTERQCPPVFSWER